ncbi:MAG: YicC/YloC family endoribonuclease [Variovorax sp.]
MAVYSMTGYASARGNALALALQTGSVRDFAQSQPHSQSHSPVRREADDCCTVDVEIRAVNSRFLDLTLKLPDELRRYEATLRERIAKRVRRGKVELRAVCADPREGAVTLPATEQLQALARLQDQVRMWLPDVAPLAMSDVLRLASGRVQSSSDFGSALLEATDHALEGLIEARASEGERLAQMLRERLAQLRTLSDRAKPLLPQLVAQQRTRFLERWQDAIGTASSAGAELPAAAQDRALAEATAFALRIDVAEELNRLGAHLEEIEALLGTGGEIGKRLDFLIQELHREVNTFGSKSAALELTRIGVDMKVLVEQMREQVQNIE